MDSDDPPDREPTADWEPRIDINDLYDDLGESGLLTRSDRELLLGLKDYTSNSHERQDRRRMRGRIQTALKDFDLLARKLDPRDREQIIVDITDYSEYPDNVYRTDEVQGMTAAMALFYAVAVEANFEFTKVVEDAIFTALHWSLAEQAPYPNVSVDISIGPMADYEDVYGKLREGKDLREYEYRVLKREVLENRGQFLVETEDIELPFEEVEAADRTLSRRHSLIAVARWLVDPAWIDGELAPEVIDPVVLRDFGFPTQRASIDSRSEDEETGKAQEEPEIEDIVDEL